MKEWPKLDPPLFRMTPGKGPVSERFNDGYASPEGAAEESRAVFLDAVGGASLWKDRPHISIAETGFGIGLNFLLTWDLFRRTADPTACLYFTSVEFYPLDRAELAEALNPHRGTSFDAELVDALLANYPPRHGGMHRIVLDGGRVHLTLIYAEIGDALSQMTGMIDAWYLDGFAPARNPEMWRDAVFDQVRRLSKPDTKAATYSSARIVRDGLERVRFKVQKRPGFGSKRDRLVAQMQASPTSTDTGSRDPNPWFMPKLGSTPPAEVAIIGGGIAGQCCSALFRARGIRVQHFDRAGNEGGLHGNPAAVIAPRLHLAASDPGQWQASSFLHAIRFYDALSDTGHRVWLDPRGLTRLPANTGEANQQTAIVEALNWPDDLLALASDRDNQGHYFPRSGTVDPESIRQALAPDIQAADIARIDRDDSGWRIENSHGNCIWQGETIILATGAWTGRFLNMPSLGLRPSRGQVSFLKEGYTLPDQTLSGSAYLTTRLESHENIRIAGSSFEAWRDLNDPRWTEWDPGIENEYRQNLENMTGHEIPPAKTGWSGLRATMSDRLPLVGPVPDEDACVAAYRDLRHGRHWVDYPPLPERGGLFTICGMGARGYQFAPLAAQLLVDQVCGPVLPVARNLHDAVHPARNLIRMLKRGEL